MKSNSPYTLEHWLNKGYSKEEAEIEIKKRRPSNSLYWLNKGYSKEEAEIKTKEHQSLGIKSRVSKKEDNPIEYYKSHNTHIEYWLNKGYSKKEAEIKLSERQNTFTKEKCIERYGQEEGLKRWSKRQEKWQNTLKSKSPDEIKRINKKKNCLDKNIFIERYGQEEGLKRWKKECNKRSLALPKMIERYGQEDGTKRYYSWKENCIKNRKNYLFSQESLKVFIPIYDWLIERGYSETDVFIGCNEMGEFKLFECSGKKNDKNNIRKRYFYDFTIPKIHIIIEYNGCKFHPHPEMNEKDWKNWKTPYGKSADDVFSYQKNKIAIAEKSGLNVLEIWSSDSVSENIKKCKEFIIDNENKLSNKKNM
ncbi:MAG: hypothetical protein WC346_12960 [Methanogenium sp.]|jgi:hypothetical protein